MRAGELIHRLTLQTQTKVPDGMGGLTVTWVDTDTVYAAIWPLRGTEPVSAQRLEGDLTHRVRIWYRGLLRLDNRFKFGNRYLYIDYAINPNERNIYLDVMVQEKVADVPAIDWSSQWSIADNLVVHIPLEEDIIPIVGADIVGNGSHVRASSSLYTFEPSGLITTVTDDVPCFETVGGLAALRDEPLGQNLIHFSHELGNMASGGWWGNTRLTSVTADGDTAPDGNVVADGLVADVNDDSHFINSPLVAGIVQNDEVALTTFAKPGNKDWAKLRINFYTAADAFINQGSYYFDISSGTIGTKFEGANVTIHDYKIEAAANGYYRIGLIISSSDATVAKVTGWCQSAHADTDDTFPGDTTTVNTWFFGADLKKQAYFDSYVPTSGATASRATESGYSEYTLPSGLFSARGTMLIWLYHGLAFGDYSAGDYGIVSFNGNAKSGLYLDENGDICTYDGTNETVHNVNWPKDVWRKYVLTWNATSNIAQVGVDSGAGVALTNGIFDGAYDETGGKLSFSEGLLAPRHLGKFRLYNKVLTIPEIDSLGSPS